MAAIKKTVAAPVQKRKEKKRRRRTTTKLLAMAVFKKAVVPSKVRLAVFLYLGRQTRQKVEQV